VEDENKNKKMQRVYKFSGRDLMRLAMERRQICDEGKGGYEQNVTSQTKVQFLK
jgi:hypothetical protein